MRRYLILVLLILFANLLFAQQQPPPSTDRRSAAKYIFSPKTDALLMSVKVWGEVKQPGIYEVPIGIDLIELLSSAGGPTNSAKLSKVKIIRVVSANPEADKSGVFTVDVEEFLDKGNYEIIPEIRPNDTVIVPIKTTHYITSSISWAQPVISLLSAAAIFAFYIGWTR